MSNNWFYKLSREKQIEYCKKLQGKKSSKYCDISSGMPLDESSVFSRPSTASTTEQVKENEEKREHSYYDVESDHEFAKKADIKNIGEDIKGSARHVRNKDRDWESITQLLDSGEVDKDFKVDRKKLEKIEPIDWAAMHTEVEGDENKEDKLLALKMFLNKFPATPGDKEHPQDFINKYRDIKDAALDIYNNSSDEEWYGMLKKLQGVAKDHTLGYRSKSKEDGTFDYQTYNKMVTFTNGIFRGKTSPWYAVNDFKRKREKGEGNIKEAILKGHSTRAPSFRDDNGPKESDFYKNAKYEATGKEKFKKADDSIKYFQGDFKARGVQFGNSMTDAKREYHLNAAANSFKDLEEVTGLSSEKLSFNGKLALAFGSRGKPGQVAHFAPDQFVLAFNSNGIGALAHEWAHAMSHHGRRGSGDESKRQAVQAIYEAIENSGIKERIRAEPKFKDMSWKKRAYWLDNEEILARAFEKHVQHKLKNKGRENTYLVGSDSNHYLWPTEEETQKLSDIIDNSIKKIFG